MKKLAIDASHLQKRDWHFGPVNGNLLKRHNSARDSTFKGTPLTTPHATAQTPTRISEDNRVLSVRRHLSISVVIATAMLAVLTICLPSRSPSTGEPSDVTFAIAWQDRPSGIYFDRQFDWPTGEAVWIDIPVWAIQWMSVAAMVGALAVHFRGSSR